MASRVSFVPVGAYEKRARGFPGVCDDERVNVTRHQGRILKALRHHGHVAPDERLLHLEHHRDWEPKELAKLAQKGLVERIDLDWRLSEEGAELLARAEVVIARLRDRGVDMQWP